MFILCLCILDTHCHLGGTVLSSHHKYVGDTVIFRTSSNYHRIWLAKSRVIFGYVLDLAGWCCIWEWSSRVNCPFEMCMWHHSFSLLARKESQSEMQQYWIKMKLTACQVMPWGNYSKNTRIQTGFHPIVFWSSGHPMYLVTMDGNMKTVIWEGSLMCKVGCW